MKSLTSQPGQRVVYPAGRITASNALIFQHQLEEIIESHAFTRLVVDMSNVDFLDSAGLMALVNVRTVAQSEGVDVVLSSIPASVQIIFELTQLDRIFSPGSGSSAIKSIALSDSRAVSLV